MVTIKLDSESYNAIVKTLKGFTDKAARRAGTDLINLYCDRRQVKALALDGNKSMSLMVPSVYPDSDECFIAIPASLKPVKVKETPYVTIRSEGDKVTVETFSGSQTVTVERPDRGIMDSIVKHIYAKTDPVKSVYFNPKLVAEVFSAIPTEVCRVDYYGETKPFEVYAKTGDELYHALVLPMRVNSELAGVKERYDT